MYIAEIAPARLRGRLVTLYQLGIVLGILAAVFVNMLIQRMGDEAWNTTVGWRWMFFVGRDSRAVVRDDHRSRGREPALADEDGPARKRAVRALENKRPDYGVSGGRADSGVPDARRRTHLGIVHHLPAAAADWNHAGGILAAQRHHAAVFFSPGNLSGRPEPPPATLSSSPCWSAW